MLEALESLSGFPVGSSTCSGWVTNNSLTHPVLRDDGSIETSLAMATYDAIVLDRKLKIVFRGSLSSSTVKTQVLTALGGLK